MSAPIITAADLGTYLNDPTIDTDRATFLIGQAQILCEDIVSPLPASGAVVVTRVAGRAYVTVTSRQAQMSAAGSPYASAESGMGGVWLSRSDIRDLRQSSADGGSFSIGVLPAGYTLTQPWWDDSSSYGGDWDVPA